MGPDDEDGIDLTEELSEETIQSLFDAFEAEDWVAVDAVLDGIDPEVFATAEAKAGGADKNRGGAEKLRRYWTRGPGAAKIRWGTEGDWTRCVEHLSKYLGPRAKGYCSLRHKEMNGFYPGDKNNKSDEGIAMSMEFKTVGVQSMSVLQDEGDGIISTIISVTGIVDNVKDKILPGAYAKTLAVRKPKGVWSHDWDTPVSKTLDVKELMPGDSELPKKMPNGQPWPKEAGALKVKTQFNLGTQRGREAYSDVQFHGDDQEWSIGYSVPVGGAKVDSKTGVREISTLDLYEYSPVLFGAMPLARTTSVKEAQMAYKALRQGNAAAWLDDAERDEGVDGEFEPKSIDDAFNESRELDADQMILVKTAIETLTDLLNAVQGETVEQKADDPEDGADEDEDGDEDYDSLASAIEDVCDDGEMKDALLKAAEGVDSALVEDDADALEKAVTAFLDVVESNMGGDADTQLQSVSELLGDLVDQVAEAVPEVPDEDNIEKKDEEEADDPEVADEVVEVINTDEIKSLLDSLNS